LVTALTPNSDPANLVHRHNRHAQIRIRKELLEQELRTMKRSSRYRDAGALREWVRRRHAGLHVALAGARNDRMRAVIATYIDRIVFWPSQKCGEMVFNLGARMLWKQNDRPKGRSRANLIGVTVRQ